MKIRVIALLTLFAICTCISATASADNPFTRTDEWLYGPLTESDGNYQARVVGHISRDINKDDVSLWIRRAQDQAFSEYEQVDITIIPTNIGNETLNSFDAAVDFPVQTTTGNIFFKYGYKDGFNIEYSPSFALCSFPNASTKPFCANVPSKEEAYARVTFIERDPQDPSDYDKYRIETWFEVPQDEIDEDSPVFLYEIIDGQLIEIPGAAKNEDAQEVGYRMLLADPIKAKSSTTEDLTYVFRYDANNTLHYKPTGAGFRVCDNLVGTRPDFCPLNIQIKPVQIPLVLLQSGQLGEPPVYEGEVGQLTPEGPQADQEPPLESGALEPADPTTPTTPSNAAGAGGYDWLSGCSLSPNAKHYGGLAILVLLLGIVPPLVAVRIKKKRK